MPEASPDSPVFREEALWYCVRTKPRQEAVAVRLLRKEMRLEVFCPKIRFKRARITGLAWVNEPMFPGYLFVRFSYPELHRRVAATSGVTRTLSFGGHPCIVKEPIIGNLRRHMADGETIEIALEIRRGEEVQVVGGPFSGVKALVTRILPARERVAILLTLLGQEREIEVPAAVLLPDTRHPLLGG